MLQEIVQIAETQPKKRMSNLPKLSMRGLHNVSESCIDVAKVIPYIIDPFRYSPFPQPEPVPFDCSPLLHGKFTFDYASLLV